MRRRLLSICAAGCVAARAHAGEPGYPIAGSKHDFLSGCAPCHLPHPAKRVSALWGRPAPDSPWLASGGAADEPPEVPEPTGYLTVAEIVASQSALCLSCHDSHTAGPWPGCGSDSHPVGVVVPFWRAGWMNDVETGNRVVSSDVALDVRGAVGCRSCHSMHEGRSGDAKLRRRGEFCDACHDR